MKKSGTVLATGFMEIEELKSNDRWSTFYRGGKTYHPGFESIKVHVIRADEPRRKKK